MTRAGDPPTRGRPARSNNLRVVIFRTLTLDDIDAVTAFAVEGMPSRDESGVRLSLDKVKAVVRHFAATPADFHLAAFNDGRVVGAIAACVSEMLFFERCEATVLVCQARGGPVGVGRHLVSELMAWAQADFRIRRIQFPIDSMARPGMVRLVKGFGFSQSYPTAVFTKG